MTKVMSEEFGLYRVDVDQEEDGFFWRIEYLDDDGSVFGSRSDNQPYATVYDVLDAALGELAKLFARDAEILVREAETEKAGNGIRTHDILLGNISLMSSPSKEAQE